MIAVPTATQNIPFVGVRGKYGKMMKFKTNRTVFLRANLQCGFYFIERLINEGREAHGKRPLKEKDDNNDPPSGPAGGRGRKDSESKYI